MNDLAGLQGPVGINWAGGRTHGQVVYGNDQQSVVIFYKRPVLNIAKTKEAKVKIFEDVTYVKIHPAGERYNVIDRPIQDADKHRFQLQWSQFLQDQTQVPEGTPIDLLFPNFPSIADNLKSYGIYTIQQLAGLSASAIDNIGMGSQDWVNKAKEYLSAATDGAAFHVMQTKIEALENTNKELMTTVKMQTQQIDNLISQVRSPEKHTTQPAWQDGVDAVGDRINNIHPSSEIAAQANRKRK